MRDSGQLLMVFVLNREEFLEEILTGFLEIGISGATVLDSTGMGRILAHDIPIFAGLRGVLAGGRPHNKTIMSVLPDIETYEQAFELIEDVCGSLDDPGNGILFALPIVDARGFLRLD
jgi:nitrogen regulatory protein P-II 1